MAIYSKLGKQKINLLPIAFSNPLIVVQKQVHKLHLIHSISLSLFQNYNS